MVWASVVGDVEKLQAWVEELKGKLGKTSYSVVRVTDAEAPLLRPIVKFKEETLWET